MAVLQINKSFQTLPDSQFLRMRESTVIQYQSVEGKAVQKTSCFSEKAAAAHGGHIKGFGKSQSFPGGIRQPPAELGNLNSVGDSSQHGKGVPSGNICAKPHRKALLQKLPHRGDS